MIKVTCALIVQNGKILLTQRGKHPHHPYQWEFPGGKLKPGETEQQCIQREIEEELELQVEVREKLQPAVFDYGFKQIQLIPFLCFIRGGKLKLTEHIAYDWLDWGKVSTLDISEADRLVLADESNWRLIKKHLGKKMNDSR